MQPHFLFSSDTCWKSRSVPLNRWWSTFRRCPTPTVRPCTGSRSRRRATGLLSRRARALALHWSRTERGLCNSSQRFKRTPKKRQHWYLAVPTKLVACVVAKPSWCKRDEDLQLTWERIRDLSIWAHWNKPDLSSVMYTCAGFFESMLVCKAFHGSVSEQSKGTVGCCISSRHSMWPQDST